MRVRLRHLRVYLGMYVPVVISHQQRYVVVDISVRTERQARFRVMQARIRILRGRTVVIRVRVHIIVKKGQPRHWTVQQGIIVKVAIARRSKPHAPQVHSQM